MMKQRIVSLVVLLGAILAGVTYVRRNFDQFAALQIERPGLIVVLLALIFFMIVVNGYMSALWYRIFGLRLTVSEWFGLSVVTTFGNFITPFRGGSVSTAVYLKQRYGFAYSSFVGILAALSIVVFWVNSLVCLVSLFFIYFTHGYFSQVSTLMFGAAFLTLTAVVLGAPTVKEPSSRWLARFARAINGWHEIRSHRRGIFATTALHVLNIGMLTLMTILEFKILGIDLDLSKALFLSIVPAFSLVVSVTPGNLGVREALAVFSGLVANVPVPEVLMVSVLDRVATFSISFILGSFYYPFFTRRMSKISV
jgi:uncharacterized membrane protein YbhN (UPF0104 family)